MRFCMGLSKGVTYLKIALYEMFNTSDVVTAFLQKFFKKLSWNGVSKYPRKNVALLVYQINDLA